MHPVIIIGSGLAGYNLAREFRKNSDAPLHIITANEGDYYSKPMLSNALTQGKTPDAIAMMDADKMRAQLNAEITIQTKVAKIDPQQHQITLENDQTLNYSKLVLAWGAEVITPAISGDAQDRIFSINQLEDYRKFRKALTKTNRIVILGSGLIGCEFANDLLNVNHKVDVVSLADRPLDTLLHESASHALASELKKKGVQWHWQTKIESANLHDGGVKIDLDNGQHIQCDLVISAIGLRPKLEPAKQAGVATNKGIIVDQTLATSQPDIFALGDCAEVCGHVYQYILPISQQVRALAKTLAGTPTKVHYPAMPISIKTPACPVVVVPPVMIEGEWKIESAGNHIRALFHSSKDSIEGFTLTGDRVKERLQLTSLIPPILPAEN